MQQKNFLLFIVFTVLILLGWAALTKYILPQPQKPEPPEVAVKDDADKAKSEDKKKGDEKKGDKKAERPAAVKIPSLPPTPVDKLITLGERANDSKFHLQVILDPRGASVNSVTLNKFQAANDLGQPSWKNPEKTEPRPLELVPARLNHESPSFLFYAFDVNDPTDDKPLDTLGRVNWKVLDKKPQTPEDGPRRESVSFQAETQGVIVTKTYTLTEGEYHIGLEVKMRRKKGEDKLIKFRYQMTGAHGLPIEGKWYTSIFRNALIARVDKGGYVGRDLQDQRQISVWGGGNEVLKEENNLILYAGVANQYFASMIVVDDGQKQRGFLRKARPTLETMLTKGVVKSIAEGGSSFELQLANGTEETFYVPDAENRVLIQARGKNAHIAVLHHTGSYDDKSREYPEIATWFYNEDDIPALWADDITVRVATEPVELKDDEPVTHKYLLYNGPVKVSQLSGPPGLSPKPIEQGGVASALVERYHDTLHLNTLTDYHSPGKMGEFASLIYWTNLVIWCTNLMHKVLGYIHAVIPSYGLCILVLTILVRGMMFPLSRKQAMMSLRMQQLAPELKKIQEKLKDDRQALGMAQMELYRKHGVNPFGSCWVLLLQMPIFMGLYFALQESIHFRLAEFWPTWINNLSAPDMMINWTERIPFISRVQDYGSFFYLGPYFNLLPVIAVCLMIAQQKMMTPPPADEQ